jgi:hypothetical protein
MQSLSPVPLGVCLLALLFAATGCHTAQVTAMAKPGADLSRYQTFNFAAVSSNNPPVLTEQYRRSMESAIIDEMTKRSYVLGKEPDLLFAIELATSVGQYNKSTPTVESGSLGSNMSRHYGLMYDQSLGSQAVVDYTQGALLVRALDTKQNQVVWEGEAVGVLYNNRPTEQVEARIREVMKQLFAKFPEKGATK